jgi:hypothetical protein
MIFAAPPPRANMEPFETTIAIAAAATVKNNFRDFFTTTPIRTDWAVPDLNPRGPLCVNVLFGHDTMHQVVVPLRL